MSSFFDFSNTGLRPFAEHQKEKAQQTQLLNSGLEKLRDPKIALRKKMLVFNSVIEFQRDLDKLEIEELSYSAMDMIEEGQPEPMEQNIMEKEMEGNEYLEKFLNSLIDDDDLEMHQKMDFEVVAKPTWNCQQLTTTTWDDSMIFEEFEDDSYTLLNSLSDRVMYNIESILS